MQKTFTIDEANRALVFVAPVMKEIQNIWGLLMQLKAEQIDKPETTISEKFDRLKYCNDELIQVGCILRDPIEGLLNFPSIRENQSVFLCWHVGEEQVEFWHSTHEDCPSRKIIDEDFASMSAV